MLMTAGADAGGLRWVGLSPKPDDGPSGDASSSSESVAMIMMFVKVVDDGEASAVGADLPFLTRSALLWILGTGCPWPSPDMTVADEEVVSS